MSETNKQYISVRITLKLDKEKTLKEMPTFITKLKSDNYIFALEDTEENEHLQGALVFNKNNKIQRIRNILKKCFPHLKGNENYSIKTTYKDTTNATIPADKKLLLYCCKGVDQNYKEGANPHIYLTNITKKEIKDYHTSYWEVNKSISLIKKAKKQNARAKSSDFYTKAYHTIYPQEKIITKASPKPGRVHEQTSPKYIKSQLIRYFAENKLIFSRNRFQNTFCFILARANMLAYLDWIEEQVENI